MHKILLHYLQRGYLKGGPTLDCDRSKQTAKEPNAQQQIGSYIKIRNSRKLDDIAFKPFDGS